MLKLSIAMLKLPIASAVLIVIFWSQVVVIVIPGLPWQPPAVRQHSTGGKYTSKHSSAPPHMISKSHRFLTYFCALSLLCAVTYCTVVTLVSLHFSTILVTLVTLLYIAVLATRACWLPDCPGLSSWLISGNHHTALPSSSQSSSTLYSLSQSSWKPASSVSSVFLIEYCQPLFCQMLPHSQSCIKDEEKGEAPPPRLLWRPSPLKKLWSLARPLIKLGHGSRRLVEPNPTPLEEGTEENTTVIANGHRDRDGHFPPFQKYSIFFGGWYRKI